MSSSSDASSSPPSQPGTQAHDRRSNLVLRALIDEMLERVREMNRASGGHMTPDERSRAEAELDAIMARVRRVASQRNAPEAQAQGGGGTAGREP
jgi:hypothetical protein